MFYSVLVPHVSVWKYIKIKTSTLYTLLDYLDRLLLPKQERFIKCSNIAPFHNNKLMCIFVNNVSKHSGESHGNACVGC